MEAETARPGERKAAALVTVAWELWSPGHWPAYAPMAAAWPLSGIHDTHSTSWADYGVTTGIRRLLDIVRDAAGGPYAYRDPHRESLDQLRDAPGPGVFRLTLYAHVAGRPLLAGMVGQILDHVRESGDVCVAPPCPAGRTRADTHR
ncbi:hypothetical protein MMF93_16525 [Streptomyces tubbatahanensis]|uniref:Uncharacterized protein n=1 Tax=Streptomyces tubbatahanensis TaxID=2923272 RepID=A0ABY3XU47_9ACTN|nr:hypothetical protein [Streptomyces tubbatahanensis]UNS97899.1 hypothetical protein MMF93_16525 [Streptomyces tubbatahanensis]